MNFSKVKLVICLFLLAVNCILALFCVRLVGEKNYVSEEEAILAQKNLYANGIEVNFGKEERKLYSLPIYSVEGSTDENGIPEIYRHITEAFFGADAESPAYVKTPDGYSASVKNKDGKVLGTSVHSNGLDFECFLDEQENGYAKPAGISFYEDGVRLEKVKNKEYHTALVLAESIFSKLGMKYIFKGTKELDGGKTVYFAGQISDVETADIYLNIYVVNGKIVSCAGSITDTAPIRKYSAGITDSIDAVYALKDYIRENGNSADKGRIRINSISMKYRLFEYGDSEYHAVPAWEICYSGSNGAQIKAIVDAVSGKNIQVSG